MNDTDRLAALLHAEWDRRLCEPSEPGVPCPDCIESAEILRAAGVTATVNPDCPNCGPFVKSCGHPQHFTAPQPAECHKGCEMCRTLNEMDEDDRVPDAHTDDPATHDPRCIAVSRWHVGECYLPQPAPDALRVAAQAVVEWRDLWSDIGGDAALDSLSERIDVLAAALEAKP